MEITRARIQGYRSLQDITVSPFSRTTILAGRNSTGKSNVLMALALATNPAELAPALSVDDFSPGFSAISLTLDLDISREENDALDSLIRGKKDAASRPLQDFLKTYYLALRWYIRVPKADPTKYGISLGYRKATKYHALWGTGAASPLNAEVMREFRRRLQQFYRLVPVRESFASIPTDVEQKVLTALMSQFISAEPTERALYNEIREALLFVTEGIGGEIQPAQLASPKGGTGEPGPLQLRAEVERSYFLPATHMGDGAQRVALILNHMVNSPQGLIAVEEPEVSLHAGAQKRFRRTLDRLRSKYGKQLLITTHSTAFLEGWQAGTLFRVDLSRGRTLLLDATGRGQAEEVARSMGVSPGDAFAADGIIWVEGPSDISVYSAFFATLGVDLEASNIVLAFGGGDAMQHLHPDDLKRLNPNFAVFLDSDRTSAQKRPTRWKRDFAEECAAAEVYVFVTQRRAIENYFSLRAVRSYYNRRAIDAVGPYDDFSAHITKHVPGKAYAKVRDAGPIARAMAAAEIERLEDLTQALGEVQRLITRWKISA